MSIKKTKTTAKRAVTDNLNKGRALEKAVGIFQEIIIESDPRLKVADCSVETTKVVTVAGVRHEIDVLVKTLGSSAYESTCVFECKNWKKPVSKNDVIILGAKVQALSANRGYLVAKTFSKDAEAQAKHDPRLSLVPCTEEFESVLNTLELLLPRTS
jgi:hypothetical protein